MTDQHAPAAVEPTGWRTRIVGFQPAVPPDQLLANPDNWRRHPGTQRDALRGSLSQVGWVDAVMVNVQTQHVVDGHARVEEALAAGATVPVIYVDLTHDEERLVLATFDPITAMATSDDHQLADLIEALDVTQMDDGLADLIHQLETDHRLADLPDRDVTFTARDLRVVEIRCTDDQLTRLRTTLDRWSDEGIHVTVR